MSDKEKIEKRIGWLLCQCGEEDFDIQKLEKQLELRRNRRDAMQKEAKRLTEKLRVREEEKPL